MWVNKLKLGRIAHCAAACIPSRRAAFAATVAFFAALDAQAGTTYWLDNSVAASGDGTSRATAFKTWNEAWAKLATLANNAKAELNVVASDTPYYVTNATPAALKGVTALAALRGVDADGNPVASPASVVIDGQNAFQIAPLGDRPCYVTVSGITFRNGLGTGPSSSRTSTGGPAAIWGLYSGSATYAANYNTVSNCVFEGCSGGTALVFVGQSNRVEKCVFRRNTCESVNSLFLATKYDTHTFTNRVVDCTFEDNGAEDVSTVAVSLLYHADVSGCSFARNTGKREQGTALYINYCSDAVSGGIPAIIRDCTFTANTNSYNGSQANGDFLGGIVAALNGSAVEMRGCTFSGNVATATYCGSGFLAGAKTGPHSLVGCTFENNVARFGGTAVMANLGNSANQPNRITLQDCILRNNDGPLVYGGHYSGGVWTLDGCTISSNKNCTAISNARTGTSFLQYTTNIVRNCSFEGNAFGSSSSTDARVRSGFYLAAATFDRCLFKGNSNNYRVLSSFGGLDVENCLFADNTGNAGYLFYPTNGVQVVNSTFVGNKNKRALFYVSGDVLPGDRVVNCIFSGNTKAESTFVQSGTEGCYRYCFTDFEVAGAGEGMVGGTAGANPGFANAAGGDYTLSKGSVCRDAGDNSPWTDDGTASGTFRSDIFDLAGNVRVTGSKVDLGCYEWCGANPGLTIFVR